MPAQIGRFPQQRRHTLYFLEEIRGVSPVYLDTEVDMTAVRDHRSAAKAEGRAYSHVAYILHAAGRVLLRHPQANAAIRGRGRPKVARYPEVNGKVTFDKALDGQRIVVAAVLPGLDRAELDQIQQGLDRLRDVEVGDAPQLKALRTLQRLPPPLARLLYHRATRPLAARPARLGTFAVTSLGHRAVDGFQSVGGTTITLGVGRVAPRPVVRDGEITIAPVMRLNLAFDHRVIDGAQAADVLTEIKEALETFPAADADADAEAADSPAQTTESRV
ncbi:2-oxo acid dehydrogenase subunit E2 [Catenulispora rubra]|uniref:2-oxo acid dehydrogenase subunit E2 n=1 Tax=Catenulispora rubra TaxID=280293 RepID=UPI00189241BB|nr:2-oxo acid dehydrogenase subunit E2 [Catenulispora rubra]